MRLLITSLLILALSTSAQAEPFLARRAVVVFKQMNQVDQRYVCQKNKKICQKLFSTDLRVVLKGPKGAKVKVSYYDGKRVIEKETVELPWTKKTRQIAAGTPVQLRVYVLMDSPGQRLVAEIRSKNGHIWSRSEIEMRKSSCILLRTQVFWEDWYGYPR